MRLLNKRLLLKEVKAKTEKVDIIRPASVDYYEVYAVGDKVEGVSKGDKVFYQQGVKFNIKGEDFILIEEDDIVAVLED